MRLRMVSVFGSWSTCQAGSLRIGGGKEKELGLK